MATHNRLVWQFAQADWEGLRAALAMHDRSPLTRLDVHDAGAKFATDTIVEYAKMYIPRRALKERKTTHPWVNDRVAELVASKRTADGTDMENQRRGECNAGILEE